MANTSRVRIAVIAAISAVAAIGAVRWFPLGAQESESEVREIVLVARDMAFHRRENRGRLTRLVVGGGMDPAQLKNEGRVTRFRGPRDVDSNLAEPARQAEFVVPNERI
jgi:hypothetical protein